MNFRFSAHAEQRLSGRLNRIVSKGEVTQKLVTIDQVDQGETWVVIKKLPSVLKIQDRKALVIGDVVYAALHLEPGTGLPVVATVELRGHWQKVKGKQLVP